MSSPFVSIRFGNMRVYGLTIDLKNPIDGVAHKYVVTTLGWYCYPEYEITPEPAYENPELALKLTNEIKSRKNFYLPD